MFQLSKQTLDLHIIINENNLKLNKMKNFKLTRTLILAQTNLEINTEKVFVSNDCECFKTIDNQGFVLKIDYLSNARNCFVFGKKLHSIMWNSMVEISK